MRRALWRVVVVLRARMWRPCRGCGARWEYVGNGRYEQHHGAPGSCPEVTPASPSPTEENPE